MERRRLSRREPAAAYLCAPATALYPLTTFSVHRTPFQRPSDRNKGGPQRSAQLKFSVVPGGQREKLWRDFFLDPSKWWGHRSEEAMEDTLISYIRRHRSTLAQGLVKPSMVAAEMAAMAPGTEQLHIFAWNKKLQNM